MSIGQNSQTHRDTMWGPNLPRSSLICFHSLHPETTAGFVSSVSKEMKRPTWKVLGRERGIADMNEGVFVELLVTEWSRTSEIVSLASVRTGVSAN